MTRPDGAAVNGATLSDERLNTHGALQPFYDAAVLARSRVTVIPVPMHWRPPGFMSGKMAKAAQSIAYLLSHVRLVRDLWRRRDYQLIIVREFLTPFLIVVWPFVWPLRSRVCFLVNHNLQEAHRRGLERTILKTLYRTGIRLGCFETTAGFDDLGIRPSPDRLLVLPHPIKPVAPPRPPRSATELPVIGVIGAVRAEKGVDEILTTLLDLRQRGRLPSHLILGCPAPERVVQWQHEFEVVDTSAPASYVAALDRCDVVVLNYRPDRYFLRPSGVAADAISRRTVVVCPDFPLMRHQLTQPLPAGTLFASLDDLERAIHEALALAPGATPDAWLVHETARGAAAIAPILDRFVEAQRH